MRVAILIEGRVKEKLVQLSKKLNDQLKSRIVLGEQALPHITLYNASFPEDVTKKIKTEMEELARSWHPFSISIPKDINTLDDGYIGFSVKGSEALCELHKEILGRLSPLRDRNIRINPAIPKARRERIERYGTGSAGEAYLPHITIGLIDPTRLSEGKTILSDAPEMPYDVKEIVFCPSEPDHTCKTVVARFKLLKE